jgi:asparagine synthase (glutamine-hydrolysing)
VTPPEPPVPSTPEEAASAVRDALEGAMDRLLAGASRVAVMTGGGVDSGALLACAVRWARRTGGSAFSVSLDFEARGDDRPHMRELERAFGCEVLRVRPEDAAGRFDLVRSGVDGTPLTWCTAPCEVEMLARARANGADVVVTGLGGDELFDGEPTSLAREASRGRIGAAVRSATRMRGFERPRVPAYSWVLRPMLASLMPSRVRRWRSYRALAQPPRWAGPTLRSVLEHHARRASERISPRRDPAARFAALTTQPSRANVAWLRHQEEVAAGIRRCDPYFDLDVVRLVTALPPEWLLLGARRRGLLREAMRGLLPERVRERMDKSDFEPALRRFVDASGAREALRPVASGARLAELGIVEPRAFAERAEAFLREPAPEDWLRIWPALACEAFLRGREAA